MCANGSQSIITTWICFFFSSRRRHTRFDCDWSSDVCSSDLELQPLALERLRAAFELAIELVGLATNDVQLLLQDAHLAVDRKSTRLNSSHSQISYAVFCLKKKKSTRSMKHLRRCVHRALRVE